MAPSPVCSLTIPVPSPGHCRNFPLTGRARCEWTAFLAGRGGWRDAQEGDCCPCAGAWPADVRVWCTDEISHPGPKIITSISVHLLSAPFSALDGGPAHPLGCPQERTGSGILSGSDISGQTRRALRKPTPR
jgi:hypothetical protein